MQLKSWQIAILGSIFSLVIPIKILMMPFRPGTEGDILSFFFALFAFVASAILSIPAILLKFDKTRKLGAVLSIIFGFGVSCIAYFDKSSGFFLLLIIAFSFIFASIYYFWKKI